MPGPLDILRWKLSTRPDKSPGFAADVKPCQPPAYVSGDDLLVTMINHSTVLLQLDGTHVLTDPMWSERASPLAWIGPRRRREPGVRWEDLPRIDVVLLSHNHYDHLDLPTMRRLAVRGQSQFVVPAGVARLLRSENIGPVHELDWGESLALSKIRIHGVPAVHFSARGPFDRNRTLWCGYFIETVGGSVYFAGDTAWGGHFASIREHFGTQRLALLPIGAYEPRRLMSPIHMGPDQAIRAHEILGAKTSIAIHHGTFQLTDESLDTPRNTLRTLAAPASFMVLKNGESVAVP